MEKVKKIVQEMLSDCDIVDDLMDDKEDKTVYISYLRMKCEELLEAIKEDEKRSILLQSH